jgi:radical SAM superfamily enzyme YgiQ (UPF0313 family)
MEEITYLYNDYGVREIHILDDNFTMRRQYVKNFCQMLIDAKINISWCCPNGIRLDSLDEELVELMKRAGCHYISVGLESGSPRILKEMKKGLRIENIREKIRMVRKSGLDINGFFILGYPGETVEDIRKTIDFAKELDLTRVAFFNFVPLPGTQCYNQLSENGELEELDWDEMFEAYVPYSPNGISKPELKSLQRRAHFEFYLRPRILLRLILSIKNYVQLKFILKRAFTYLFKSHG